MTRNDSAETHHGVLLNISGQGVFIMGEPGIGKSSLALECLYQGHQLIADDIAEFIYSEHQVIGQCPILLADLLHTKELGLIPVTKHFGKQAWQEKTKLDIIVKLHNQPTFDPAGLRPCLTTTLICKQSIPTLTLSTHNPASLAHRIQTGIAIQATMRQTETEFKQKQQHIMAAQ
jgi:HPr kinase/phosphorylase